MVKNNNPDGPKLSRGRKINDFIKELGGGQLQGQVIYLSENLPNYSRENGTQGKFAKKHCLGGIFMHELLYHAHTVGLTDKAASMLNGSGEMQHYYLLHSSNPHDPGTNQLFPSINKKT